MKRERVVVKICDVRSEKLPERFLARNIPIPDREKVAIKTKNIFAKSPKIDRIRGSEQGRKN